MRTLIILTIHALLIGDGLVALVAAIKMFIHRKLSRAFLFQSFLFFCLFAHTGMLLAAFNELPAPRDEGFRLYFLLALACLSAGIYPIALHLLLLKNTPEPVPPGTLFIGDARNHRAHRLDCSLLMVIPASSRAYFASSEAAKEASYSIAPCCRNGD
jgi:hypothetical protein